MAVKKPPIMKHIVASNDAQFMAEIPMIECPLVHPPAYLVPNPTKNPPITKIKKPLKVKTDAQFTISVGISALE